MAEEARVDVTPVYIVGAHTLMNKGQILPSQGGTLFFFLGCVDVCLLISFVGVVIIEYQQPIPYKGQTHEQWKEQVEASLKEAEKRWEGKKMRRGGYSLMWCLIPIAVLLFLILRFLK
jgi:hypothetical protein